MAVEVRVLMLCPQFRPLIGGYELAAERLSGELVRQGCAVTIITERRQKGWASRETLKGFLICRLACVCRPSLHSLSSMLSHAAWLLRYGRRFDVWHVHQYGVIATAAVLLGKVLRRPVVLKLTSSAHQGIAAMLETERLAGLQTWAHRRVDCCIAISRETAQEAIGFGIDACRVERVGNGVNTDTFKPVTEARRAALRRQLGLPPQRVAIFVGRLAEEKNPLGLLEAWALARTRFRAQWTLVLVGDGPLRGAIEKRLVALRISDSVVLAGQTERVQDWLNASNIYLLSSHNEGLSNTTLEAMACGLPSVVTQVSGMIDLVRETGAGHVVPVGSIAAFADALAAVHCDTALLDAMGARARAVVVHNFGIEAVAQQHLALYRRLLK